MRYRRGLVIGKFYPPHRGHRLLIETAAGAAERVTAIVCARQTDSIPGELRGRWLRELHPGLEVLVVDDHYDPDDSRLWAELTIGWLRCAPDVVFSSESYGERYARFLGCAHVPVDPDRVIVPCSATAVRDDPFASWYFLDPPVRAWFAKRVCVVGAESTGTTTLARALACHYGTVCVAEYGREYTERKYGCGDLTWVGDEFVHIGEEQVRREEAAAGAANRVLISDTDAMATALWHRRYLGCDNERVRRIAAGGKCALYLLTGDEIPFVQDGYRDGEHVRHAMHRWFEEALAGGLVPWLLVRGPHETSLRQAVAAVNALFEGSAWRPPAIEPR